MVAVSRAAVERDLRALERRVRDLDSTPEALATVGRLVQEALKAADASEHSGGQAASPARRGRQVAPAELEAADAAWSAAEERGRRYRDDALAELGPVLGPGEVARRLGVSTVTVSNWRRQNRLLGLRFDGHQYLYPLFQFVDTPARGERGVLSQIEQVLGALAGPSAWAKAQFLLSPAPFLGGQVPLDVLRGGRTSEVEQVLKLAEAAGEMGA
jgi:hypothetical protein